MYKGKLRYLEQLTPKIQGIFVEKRIDGTSPPSVFIGREGYPKVFIGPLVTQEKGDTRIMDTPERWLEGTPQDVISFRLKLARGMSRVGIKELENPVVSKLRDIALAARTVDTNAEFERHPRGYSFNEDHQPFGPSAPIKNIEISNVRYEKDMEKAYYDIDMNARTAIMELYQKGVLVSQIQKAFSIGAFGNEKNRRLVPTRWSITAVDDTIGLSLLEEIKHFPIIDTYQVYEFNAFNNYFAILLMPTQWQYEFLEVFINVLGNEELIFSDWEPYEGRKEYAQIGGCYYSTRLAIAEKLKSIGVQAGALVFRESYPGYVPLGVWLVRETSREALRKEPKEFESFENALSYIRTKLWLPWWKYKKQSILLKQKTLKSFLY